MTKPTTDDELREYMSRCALALLKASYGAIVDGVIPDEPPKPDVFNAAAGWLRTNNGLPPLIEQKSGLELMTEGMKRGRTKG